ncbi:lipoprotein [unidentified eubacterium SCB49]|nr:lipoprotein [unidentified eubacterium SCB49]
MKKITYLLLLTLFMSACGSKKTIPRKNRAITSSEVKKPSSSKQIDNIINEAMRYKGTRYKYGGTTKSGMDCSGLVYVSFKENNIDMPRVSRDMATRGTKVSVKKAKEGDLLFFQTNKNRRVINHVGIVTAVQGDDIKFIHSSTSRGVIVSSLKEKYWNGAFVEIRRII